MKKITIIVPAYNEEESLPFLYERLTKLIDSIENYKFEVLFINVRYFCCFLVCACKLMMPGAGRASLL